MDTDVTLGWFQSAADSHRILAIVQCPMQGPQTAQDDA